MLHEPQSCPRNNLPCKKVQVDWGNVLRGGLVHRPNFPPNQKLHTRGNIVHVGGGQDRDAIFVKEPLNAPQKRSRVFQMFNHFHGCNQIKLGGKFAIELRIVEVDLDEFRIELEIVI